MFVEADVYVVWDRRRIKVQDDYTRLDFHCVFLGCSSFHVHHVAIQNFLKDITSGQTLKTTPLLSALSLEVTEHSMSQLPNLSRNRIFLV